MKRNITGLSENIAVTSIVILIINILKDRQSGEDAAAYAECIHNLEDFLWNYAGIATGDGNAHECDTFLRACGYDSNLR